MKTFSSEIFSSKSNSKYEAPFSVLGLKPKADNFKGWVRHHRLETHTSDGFLRLVQLSKAELIALDMYYDRPAEELIWLKAGEHRKVHGKLIGGVNV